MLYKSLIRPLLFLGDPEKTHEQTLALLSKIEPFEGVLERLFRVQDERLQVRVGPLIFPNPVGLAGGFDKNAVAVKAIAGFGFGFIEIGAVTALAQPGNPKPRLYRLPEDEALINRLGFNNEGATAIAERLRTLRGNGTPLKIPLGINIGRSKIVETKDAAADYVCSLRQALSLWRLLYSQRELSQYAPVARPPGERSAARIAPSHPGKKLPA